MLLATRACLRRLGRMRARAVGVSLLIGLALAMIVSGAYSGAVLDQSVADHMEEGRMPDLFFQLGGGHDADEVEAALGAVQGVEAFETEQRAVGAGVASDGQAVHVSLVGVEDPARADISVLELVQGRLFLSQGEAVAVTGMEARGFGVGDRPMVQVGPDAMQVEVVGVVRGAEYVYTSAFPGYIVPGVGAAATLIVPLGAIPSFVGDEVNQANVLLDGQGDAAQVMAALQPFDVVSVLGQEDHPSTMFVTLGAQKMRTMLPIIGYIFMAVGIATVFMTMARLVLSDARQVGVLMSLGYGKGRIARGYLAMGAVLAGAGLLVGLPLALLMTMGFVQAVVGIFFEVDLSFPFQPAPFLLGAMLVLAAVLLAISIPVAMVTRRTVREALEHRPDEKVRRSSLSLGAKSMIARMGLRNAVRRPLRTAATVLVIAMTIGLAGSWLIMSDSALGYIDEQIAADTWDLRAELSSATGTASVDAALLGLEEQDVLYVAPASQVRAALHHGTETGTAALLASDDWGKVRGMSPLEGQLDYSGLVVTKDLADQLGLSVGDQVVAALGASSMTAEVTGIISDVMTATAYTSPGTLAPLFPEGSSNLAFVALAQPSSAAEKASEMRAMASVSSVLVHSDLGASMDEMVDLAIGMLYAFFGISMLITVVVTGVAIMVSMLERDMELATLSTLGASRREVAKGIVVEMLAIGGMAALVAVPVSYLISALMAQAMSQVVFYFPVSISIEGTAAMAVLGLLLVLASSYVPMRYARKLRTDQTLRERSSG